MANKLTKLLRKVFLSSLAGIAANNTSAAINDPTVFEPNKNGNRFESYLNLKPDLSPKLLLKKILNDGWTFMAHRSHRSHSSHQSHRSHYSSSGGGSGTSTPKANPSNQPNSTTNSLQLGARTLKKGMSGTDVTELVNILLRKEYLKLDDGGTVVTGSYAFDETIEGAVKKFQSDNGLTSDGVCGSTTIYYLKNK